jgi:4-amino-4-deoxy-L-arabinose transferase-like glycosyltransferase
MTFSACLALALASFARACVGEQRSDSKLVGLGFFAALGLAVLAKGPAALAIAGATIGIWCALERDVTPLRRLPWLGGALVFLAVCAPWYALAEARSPGFLRYFFLEENLMRFATATYEDRYGEPHVHPYGTALLFAAAGFLPWTFAVTRRRLSSFERFALAWALACPLLFSASRNLVPQYLLPSLPGFALFLAAGPIPRRTLLAAGIATCLALGGAALFGVTRLSLEPRAVAGLAFVAAAGLVTLLALRGSARRILLATAVLAAAGDLAVRASFRDEFANASAARLARELESRRDLADCEIVYWGRRPWSAWFYLDRPADALRKHTSLLRAHLADGRCHVLVFLAKDLDRVKPSRRGERLFEYGDYRVHFSASASPAGTAAVSP